MKLFSRLLGSAAADPREGMRPLWHRVVEIAREKHWYAERGVADTVEGRFDMITAILSLVLVRLEQEGGMEQQQVHLTELFVEDMDGQLRESGVGDVVVGKHMGRLMSALGGRLGAYRSALQEDGETALAQAVSRNLTLREGESSEAAAHGLHEFYGKLRAAPTEALLAAEV